MHVRRPSPTRSRRTRPTPKGNVPLHEHTIWNEFIGALNVHSTVHEPSVNLIVSASSENARIIAVCPSCEYFVLVFDVEEAIHDSMLPTPPLTGPGHYNHDNSPIAMLYAVRSHVEENVGHVLRSVDDPGAGRWGFACVGCRTMWTIAIEAWVRWRHLAPPEHSMLLRMLFTRRTHLADLLSSDGEMLKHLDPLPPEPSARSAYDRLLEDEDP